MNEINALGLAGGEEVGGYRLVSRLGGGAMGTVWRVEDGAGQQYAMKILRDSLYDEHQGGDVSDSEVKEAASARERLRREAAALRKIHHPGVCQIVDLELDDALAFIVTELIDGSTLLKDVANNGRYVADDLERLAHKLIDAVAAVHAAGIIHRDIKPSNVMVAATGPVLVDFGIAMGQGESHVTRTGLVMGTPGFIAPEIIDGAESSNATDWWSLTSVLAFAATGRPVFGAKPLMTVLEREAHGNADLSGLPVRTRQAFQAALAPNPTARCTPHELLRVIHEDALDPDLWQWPEDNSAHNTAESDKTAVMRPFESPATEPGSTLPYAPNATAAPTVTATVAATTPTVAPTSAPTVSLRSQWEDDPQPPEFEPSVGEQTEQTQALSSEPATPGEPGQTAVLAHDPAAIPPAPEPEIEPTLRPAPEQALDQAPDQATASEQRLAQLERIYAKRGTAIPLLLTVPIALTAASIPCVAIMLAALALWFMLTAGFNEAGALERLVHNTGRHPHANAVLRVVTLPWHMLRSLAALIPRMLILLLIAVAVVGISVIALNLPVTSTHAELFGRAVGVILLADGPVSHSGLALAGGVAIGWLLMCFGPRSLVARIGSGALRGVDVRSATGGVGDEGEHSGQNGANAAGVVGEGVLTSSGGGSPADLTDHSNPTNPTNPTGLTPTSARRSSRGSAHRSPRGTILLLIWLALTLAAASLLFAPGMTGGVGIDWWPIPLLE